MRRQFLALILFFAPAVTMAQRYGRPYSLAPNPQVLLLEVKFQKQHHYFRAADFRKMPRSSVTVIDAATHAPTCMKESPSTDSFPPPRTVKAK